MAITAIPIQPVQSAPDYQFRAERVIEEATQTFKNGTVVSLAADGGVQAWNGATYGTAFTGGALGAPIGISYESASNLATTGKGAPVPFSPLTGVGAAQGLFGYVQNEPSAVNIAHGAPINDGRVGFFPAASGIIFSATFGNAGSPATPSNTNVGVVYGMTIDSGGNFWYVDASKVTAGTNTLVKVTGLDPRDVPGPGTRVLFQFLPYAVYLLS